MRTLIPATALALTLGLASPAPAGVELGYDKARSPQFFAKACLGEAPEFNVPGSNDNVGPIWCQAVIEGYLIGAAPRGRWCAPDSWPSPEKIGEAVKAQLDLESRGLQEVLPFALARLFPCP